MKKFCLVIINCIIIITFISLFFIICCDCCNCCCGTQCCKGTCSRVCLSFITAGLFGVSFILNITTVSLTPKTFKGLNGASCSLFHFIDDIEEGETKETTPKWEGFTNLTVILSDVKKGISKANESEYGKNFDKDKSDFDNYIEAYSENLTNSNNIVMKNDNVYKSIEVNFPKGKETHAGENRYIIPEYIKTWGNNKKVGSYLYLLQYEYLYFTCVIKKI